MSKKTKFEIVTDNGLKFVKETNEFGLATFSVDGKEVDSWELIMTSKYYYEIKIVVGVRT